MKLTELAAPMSLLGVRVGSHTYCRERLGLLESGGDPLSTLPLAPAASSGFPPQNPHISVSPYSASG